MARPRQQRSQQTMERVFEATLALFAREGESGLSAQAISKTSGVSVGSIYHHFGSLEGVVGALYIEAMTSLLDAVVAPLDHASTAQAGIEAMARAYLEWTLEHLEHATLIHAAPMGAPSYDPTALWAAKGERVARIRAWLLAHIEGGQIVELPEAMYEIVLIGPLAELVRRGIGQGAPRPMIASGLEVLPARIWAALRRAT